MRDLSLRTLRPRGSEWLRFSRRFVTDFGITARNEAQYASTHARHSTARTEERMDDKGRGDVASVPPATSEDAARAELYKEEANEYFKSTYARTHARGTRDDL